MNESEPRNKSFWSPKHIAACGPIAHVVTAERVQQFTEDNYERRLTDDELFEVSILLFEAGDEQYLDAAVRQVISI